MLLDIVTYPNSLLRKVSKDILSFDVKLHHLLDNMYDTMIASGGIGLAAIQVGAPLKVLIINIPNEKGEQNKENTLEIINPHIELQEGEVLSCEGCLSLPEFREDIKRYKNIKVNYFNRKQEPQEIEADDLLSIALQHEIDHLNGVLFIDKLPILARKKFIKEYKKSLKQKI